MLSMPTTVPDFSLLIILIISDGSDLEKSETLSYPYP